MAEERRGRYRVMDMAPSVEMLETRKESVDMLAIRKVERCMSRSEYDPLRVLRTELGVLILSQSPG